MIGKSLMDGIYEHMTRDILVAVEPIFLEEESSPDDSQYVWAYTIAIENLGQETVQLRSRHWQITDSTGNIQEVRGEGVVGEQPVLHPGETFEYTSGTPLSTASGFMGGTYQMQTTNGEMFDVVIPTFSLDSPHQVYSLH